MCQRDLRQEKKDEGEGQSHGAPLEGPAGLLKPRFREPGADGALFRKSLIGRTIPFPVTFQAMASISALPRAEKRFIMAMRIWISAV
ncbi:hypothetical protein, partial [Rhodovulum sulfidophilum]|uniref:hypothetical protein n=1 Tax=Rhodovulum sulfidophilum TaxID=35806 RepID=UPI001F1EBBCC